MKNQSIAQKFKNKINTDMFVENVIGSTKKDDLRILLSIAIEAYKYEIKTITSTTITFSDDSQVTTSEIKLI